MRKLTCLICLSTIISLLVIAPALAIDSLGEMENVYFVPVESLDVGTPHGTLHLGQGMACLFLDKSVGGIFIGTASFEWNNLPSGDIALNLFNEIGVYAPDHPYTQQVSQFYLSAAGSNLAIGDNELLDTPGWTWDELSADEQEAFEAVYLMARSDGWLPAPSGPPMGMGGHPGAGGKDAGFQTREPVDNELFLAYWDEHGTRWDYRINADASTVSLLNYNGNMNYVQVPWSTDEWVAEENVVFERVAYGYSFTPLWPHAPADGKGGAIECVAVADFTVKEPTASITVYSNPTLPKPIVVLQDMKYADLPQTTEFGRDGADGLSAWELRVNADFQPGVKFQLVLESVGETDADFASVGYGGAFRFDTTLLWPGEGVPVDLEIAAQLAGREFAAIASGNAEMSYADYVTAAWPGSTRNQMLVLTEFPSTIIPTSWGEMEVFAPEEMMGDLDSLEAVQAIGPIVQYYTDLWGARGVDRLPVFIIPEETGVQGFEDAGMVFILGGDGGQGGAGGAMGGLTALMAHELVHLWWGYDVSAPRWFVEGMANYGAAKYLEYEASQGQGSNVDDPTFYRRYIMNFALANELPLSMLRRDELDDEASIYHNGPAALLTLDQLRPYGIDGILRQLHEAAAGQPELDEEELRGIFCDLGGDEMAGWWDSYIEGGYIPVEDEDPTYRRLAHTPARDDYQQLLGWLMPARRKQYSGDLAGALYCAKRGLEYRSEPKDFIYVADLTMQVGNLAEALERCMALMENPECDALNRVKAHWIMAQIYRERGETAQEMLELEFIVENGSAAGAMYETGQARERLAELTGEAPAETDAESGATPNPHGG